MILVALIYSVTSSLGKIAVTHSSPAFFGAAYYLGIVLCLLPLVAADTGGHRFFRTVRRNVPLALLPALFLAVMALTHYAAINLGNVAYVISIKRSSLLIGSLYGVLFFHEKNEGRLVGALLMFSGFVLIVSTG